MPVDDDLTAAIEAAVEKAVKAAMAPYAAQLTTLMATLTTVKSQVETLEKGSDDLGNRIAVVEKAMDHADTGRLDDMEYIERSLADGENRDRRQNVVISGCRAPRTGWKEVERTVLDLFKKIGLDFSARDIVRAHHLTQSPDSPLIVKFHHYKDAEKTFDAFFTYIKTKDADRSFGIKRDFSSHTRVARGKLYGTLLRLKNEPRPPNRPAPKLKVECVVDGNTTYRWHARREQIECRQGRRAPTFTPLETVPGDNMRGAPVAHGGNRQPIDHGDRFSGSFGHSSRAPGTPSRPRKIGERTPSPEYVADGHGPWRTGTKAKAKKTK